MRDEIIVIIRGGIKDAGGVIIPQTFSSNPLPPPVCLSPVPRPCPFCFISLPLSSVGWGVDQGVGGFGDDPGIKAQVLNLIRSVRTVMRGKKA